MCLLVACPTNRPEVCSSQSMYVRLDQNIPELPLLCHLELVVLREPNAEGTPGTLPPGN